MSLRHNYYGYSAKEVFYFLAANSYKCDKTLTKKGQNPDELRSVLASIFNDDYKKTKVVDWESHSYDRYGSIHVYYILDNDICDPVRFLDNHEPEVRINGGITFKYAVHGDQDDILVLFYDPDYINGELDGEVIYGRLACLIYRIKPDNSLDWTKGYWEEDGYTSNIVELFNLHPRIIADLCNHPEIGCKKLLQILKLNQ